MEELPQNNSILEIILISLIIGLEFYYFIKIYRKIEDLEDLYPEVDSLVIIENSQEEKDTEAIDLEELEHEEYEEENTLSNLKELFSQETKVLKQNSDDRTNVISCKYPSEYFRSILDSTNDYLHNNKDGVVDFNIVKGISEGVDNTIERSILSMVSIPLYIGLLGTVAGIIFSLFSINLDTILETGSISMFLNGVKIAMFANFFGLFFTLLNSAFFMKNAVFARDINKTGYYSFIQSHLLPKVSTDIASSIRGLQQTLENFNVNFGKNINEFNSNTVLVSQNLKKQNEFLNTIKELGIENMVQANLLLFETFNKNVGTFDHFISNQKNLINQFDQFKSTIFKVDQIMQNVIGTKEYFETTLHHLDKKVDVADQLFNFLQTQYSGIQNITDSTKQILSNQDDRIQGLFESYQEFLENLVASNNKKVQQLIEDSEDNIKQLVLDKEFLSLNANVKEIIKQLPDLKNKMSETTSVVKTTASGMNVINNKIDTAINTSPKKRKLSLSRKNIASSIRSVFFLSKKKISSSKNKNIDGE